MKSINSQASMSFFFKKGDKLGSYEIDPNVSIQSLAQNKSAVILMAMVVWSLLVTLIH